MTLYKWDKTADDNDDADSTINAREGMAPSLVNNSMRGMMAAVAKWRDDTSGLLETEGSASAYTITTNQVYTSLTDGMKVAFRAHATNSAGPTLNVDSLGAKALRGYTGASLIAGRILIGSVYTATYRSSSDEWLLDGADGGLSGLTAAGVTLLGGASAAAQATSLGLGTGNSPQFAGVNLGHASNTTLAQGSAAGIAAVESKDLAFQEPTINAQTGTTYTLVLTDKGKVVTMSNSSTNTLTIPANASVAFPVGTIINVLRLGTGTTVIDADTGVTLNGVSGGQGNMPNQYQGVALTKIGTDTWIASGDIEVVA